jgi:hypothetical protein
VARKSKKKGKGRSYACWSCGGRMKKRRLHCKKCTSTRPAAVKAQTAFLAKAYGGSLRPVAVPAAAQAARAEKSARTVQLSVVHSAEWWEAQARAQWNPAEREQCYAEARKASQARGQESSSLVSLLVKASGAGSVREAWLREADPHAREVLLRAINQGGGRSA